MAVKERRFSGTEIRRRREAAGRDPGEFAVAVGIDRSALWRIETGDRDPRFNTAKRIADELGCDIADLLEDGAA